MARPDITLNNLLLVNEIIASTTDIPAVITARGTILKESVDSIVDASTSEDTPIAVANLCAVRVFGYLWDSDPSEPRAGKNPFYESGAAGVAARYMEIGGAIITKSGAVPAPSGSTPSPSPAPSVFTPQSAFAFRAKPKLTQFDITADEAIASSGDGYIVKLLDDQLFAGGLEADSDFFTFFEGFIKVEVANSANVTLRLHVTHKIGANFAKEFDISKDFQFDLVGGVIVTIPMNVYDSISGVPTGSVTVGGKTIVITDDDLAAPSKITYAIEVLSAARKTQNRNANTLKTFESVGAEVISFQLRQAVTGGTGPSTGGNLPTPPSQAEDYIITIKNGVITWVPLREILPSP